MSKPRLLDLFCGAGGAAMGYHRAGFQVVGVDIAPQPNYPFSFVQYDALKFLARILQPNCGVRGQANKLGMVPGYFLDGFAAIHASPPCQGYSRLRHLPWLEGRSWPLLIEPCMDLLELTGKPWVIENVEDAPIGGIVLCGQMFGLPVYRHRRFVSNVLLLSPSHSRHRALIGSGRMVNDRRKAFRGTLNAGSEKGSWGRSPIVTVAGGQFRKADGERALGISWMTRAELCQAIPPAYTEFIGLQLINALEGERTC